MYRVSTIRSQHVNMFLALTEYTLCITNLIYLDMPTCCHVLYCSCMNTDHHSTFTDYQGMLLIDPLAIRHVGLKSCIFHRQKRCWKSFCRTRPAGAEFGKMIYNTIVFVSRQTETFTRETWHITEDTVHNFAILKYILLWKFYFLQIDMVSPPLKKVRNFDPHWF